MNVRPLPSASAGKPRSQSIDIVKGMAITLVVLGHTLGGAIMRGWWTTPRAGWLYNFIYSFHMPAFFFVSGLLVGSSLKRLPANAFLADKAKVILYPYVLWILIRWALQPLTGGLTSTYRMVSPLDLFTHMHFEDPSWFLQCLFLCMVLTVLTRALPDWLRVVLALAVCLAVPDRWFYIVVQVAREWPFMAIGQLIGSRIAALTALRQLHAGIMLVALLVFQTTAVIYFQPAFASFPIRGHALFVVLGLTGIIGLFCAARLILATHPAYLAAWVGEASIAIYLLHPFFQGATRAVVLHLLHTSRPVPQLALTTIVATLAPALIWHLRKPLRIGWLFRWGPERPAPKPAKVETSLRAAI